MKTTTRKLPRETRGGKARAAILTAAENIFAKSGLAGARTDAIAKAAGVNKAMLYNYFKSKDDLYEAVLEDHFREFNRQALEILSQKAPARKVLLQYVDLQFDFISQRHRYASLFQQLMMTGGKPLEHLVHKYFAARAQALRQLLIRGMRSGEFRQGDPLHSAVSITALIVFYFSTSHVLPLLGLPDAYTPANLRRRKREVLDFIRHAVFKKP